MSTELQFSAAFELVRSAILLHHDVMDGILVADRTHARLIADAR
jgi:hypothetical protein